MSHFSVLVIGDDYEAQLAPYDENTEVECYKVRVSDEDLRRFIEFYSNPTPTKDYEVTGVERAKELGFYPVTETTARGAWAALSENWNGGKGGWDEDGPFEWSTYNPKSKWDWYSIGGRWLGHWKLKAGVAAGVIGQPGTFDNRPTHDADQARKGDIDFEGMEAEEARKAALDWAKWEPILALPMAAPWAEFVARVEAKDITIDEARQQYHAQAQVQALERAFPDHWRLSPEDFGSDREEYIATRAAKVWVPFALVRDGEWHEKGRMGWFGMSTDKPEDQAPWTVEVRSLVLSLPDDTLLTIVDCHI